MVALSAGRPGHQRKPGSICQVRMQKKSQPVFQKGHLRQKLLAMKSVKPRPSKCATRRTQKAPLRCSPPFSPHLKRWVYVKNLVSTGTWMILVFQRKSIRERGASLQKPGALREKCTRSQLPFQAPACRMDFTRQLPRYTIGSQLSK